jgi:hypothetical protein
MTRTIDERHTLPIIRAQVWGGFEDQESILWDCLQAGCGADEPTDDDIAWVKEQLASEWNDKLAKEHSWPPKVEFDRLEEVFAQLRNEGVISLHRAGGDMSGGLHEVRECRDAEGDRKGRFIGYCFYHSQDLDRAVASGRMFLAFGAIGSTSDAAELRKEKNIAVAARIIDLLNAANFVASWSGDFSERIHVDLGQWRKRSPFAR